MPSIEKTKTKKRTNIRCVLHQSSSISALPEHPFLGDVSVAQLVALASGVVLSGVAKVVGRISLEAKYLQHLSAQFIHYIPPYLSTV